MMLSIHKIYIVKFEVRKILFLLKQKDRKIYYLKKKAFYHIFLNYVIIGRALIFNITAILFTIDTLNNIRKFQLIKVTSSGAVGVFGI